MLIYTVDWKTQPDFIELLFSRRSFGIFQPQNNGFYDAV